MSVALRGSFQLKPALNSGTNYPSFTHRSASLQQSGDQRYRDCSIYNKNLSLQILKEQMFRDREIELRKKYEGMNDQEIKACLPKISNTQTYDVQEVYNRPLSPKSLDKQTYLEIFNSKKNSMRKPLNFINYSNMDYNVISNNGMTVKQESFVQQQTKDIYTPFLQKRLDYKTEIPQYKDGVKDLKIAQQNYNAITFRILDDKKIQEIQDHRKHVKLNMKSHILKNIQKLKDRQASQREGSQCSQERAATAGRLFIRKRQPISLQESPTHNGFKAQTGGYIMQDFYRMLDPSKNNTSVIQKRTASVVSYSKQQDQLKNKSTQQQQEQALGESFMRVQGTHNPIKENAYSDVNVKEIEQQKGEYLIKQRKQIQTSHHSQRQGDKLSQHNLKQLESRSVQSSRAKRDKADSQNGSQAFSQRWKNLEDYINTKKSKKDKDQAMSHATSIIGDDLNERSTIISQKRKQRVNKSVADIIETIKDDENEDQQSDDQQINKNDIDYNWSEDDIELESDIEQEQQSNKQKAYDQSELIKKLIKEQQKMKKQLQLLS